MDCSYCVYCHRNKVNNKVYIGITNNIRNRWRNGKGYADGHNPLFSKAIAKYGWDGFEHIILHSGISLEEAKELEQKYIAEYKSNVYRYNNPSYGYNLTDGGEGFAGVDRSGDKNSFYGRHHSEETKKILSDIRIGYKNPFYGRKLSDEEIHRLVDTKKREVICVTTGEIFESASDAGRHFGISQSAISQCCNGKNNRVHGMVFRYTDNQDLVVAHKRNSPKPVLCQETGIVYPTTVAAAKATGAKQAAIWDCCNNRRKAISTGGYTWRYAIESEISHQLRGAL